MTTRAWKAWWIVLPQALGYVVLSLLHRWNSLPALEQGRLFTDLGYGGDANGALGISQFLTLAYLFALYALTLRYWSRVDFKMRELSWTVAALGTLAWSALPANSSDLLTYVGFGRMASVHGANPYLHTYSEFADAFSPYAAGSAYSRMPYGPATLPLFMAAGLISLKSVMGAIYALKFIWLLVHGANCWLIYSLLKNRLGDARYGVFLFGCNPLVLLELVGNGHNDGLMILFCLGALYALQRGRSHAAAWLALIAGLVKSPALIFLGAVLVYLAKRGERRAVTGVVLAGSVAALTLPWILFPTLEARLALIDFVPFANAASVHSVLIDVAGGLLRRLSVPVAPAELFAMERGFFSLLFAAFAIWRLSRISDLESLVREVGIVWLGLIVGYAAMFYPWYVTWLVPLAALTESGSLRRVIAVYSFTVLSLYTLPAVVAVVGARQWLWATFRIGVAHFAPLGFSQPGTWRGAVSKYWHHGDVGL